MGWPAIIGLLMSAYAAQKSAQTKAPGIDPGAAGPGFGGLTEGIDDGPKSLSTGGAAPSQNIQSVMQQLGVMPQLNDLGIEGITAGAIPPMGAPLPGREATGGGGAPAQKAAATGGGFLDKLRGMLPEAPEVSGPRSAQSEEWQGRNVNIIDQLKASVKTGGVPTIFDEQAPATEDTEYIKKSLEGDRRMSSSGMQDSESMLAGTPEQMAAASAAAPAPPPDVSIAPTAKPQPKQQLFDAVSAIKGMNERAGALGPGGQNQPVDAMSSKDLQPLIQDVISESGAKVSGSNWQDNAALGAQIGSAIGAMIMRNQTKAPGLPGSRSGSRMGQFRTLAESFMRGKR